MNCLWCEKRITGKGGGAKKSRYGIVRFCTSRCRLQYQKASGWRVPYDFENVKPKVEKYVPKEYAKDDEGLHEAMKAYFKKGGKVHRHVRPEGEKPCLTEEEVRDLEQIVGWDSDGGYA